MTCLATSVEDAFFAYAKKKTKLSPKVLAECLKKAANYCQLKQSLLGMTNVKLVRSAQQKVAEGKLLHFCYGKDAQNIRNVTQLYYNFVKSYHAKPAQVGAEPIFSQQIVDVETQNTQLQQNSPKPVTEVVATVVAEEQATSISDISLDENIPSSSTSAYEVLPAEDINQANFNQDSTYTFTEETSVSDARKLQKQTESSGTIKDAIVTVLQGTTSPMSVSDILEQIRLQGLYQFNVDNPLSIVKSTIRQHCVGLEFPDHSKEKPFCLIKGVNGKSRFYLKKEWSEQLTLSPSRPTIKDVVITVLRDADEPMSTSAILDQIQRRGLYQFNSEKPLPIVLNAIKKNCEEGVNPHFSWEKTFRFVVGEDGKHRYLLANSSAQKSGGQTQTIEENDSMLAQVRSHILSFVSESFPHGIRPGSIIDINKLKRIYQKKIGEDIPVEVDVALLLTSVGLQSGEKVYFLSEDQKQSLFNLIMRIVEDGHRVIYYSELLLLHGELFESCHIYESPLMQTVLRSVFPTYIYKADCMLVDRNATEIEEITRAFGENVLMTYRQLKSLCPYLTLDVIKWTLSRSDSFVWSSPETYAYVDLIELDQAEVADIINRILPQIREEGYFSLAQLPIEESCGMNPQISSSAIRDAIYKRYMSQEFTRNGLIVKLPGIHLNSYELIKTWLKGLEQVTLTEIEEYEHELTGHHAMLGIAAASTIMVRIDHDHYVSDNFIQFDVEAVDHAISLFVTNRIIPITAITSYTSFPNVPGYNWNLYLVESFLRRFSKRFTIDGGPAQVSYVGGICSADMHFENYEDRLAHAVLQDGVSLTEEAIGRYLTEHKYILRRGKTVRKTLERAKTLNEQRGNSSVRI